MKNKITIFSNNKTNHFLGKLLPEYELSFSNLEEIIHSIENITPNIIIINKNEDKNIINFDILNNNYLLFYNSKIMNFPTKLENVLKTPLSIKNLRNVIENFVENLKIKFHDITIVNEKLTNIKNNLHCYLTKAEAEILIYLIREKVVNKNHVKENILNIKTSLQTNSLESHLTRIRKKMNKIETSVKIHSKSEKLFITI